MTPEETTAALERAVKTIANQNATIMLLKDRLDSVRYHFNVAVTSLEKIAAELRKGDGR
jgi:hypothetical protein